MAPQLGCQHPAAWLPTPRSLAANSPQLGCQLPAAWLPTLRSLAANTPQLGCRPPPLGRGRLAVRCGGTWQSVARTLINAFQRERRRYFPSVARKMVRERAGKVNVKVGNFAGTFCD